MAEKRTYHEGAEAERKAFKAYLKRQQKANFALDLQQILNWIKGRCARYHKRKGGL